MRLRTLHLGYLDSRGLVAPSWLAEIESVSRPDPQPLFRIVPGPVAELEITLPSRTPR